MSLAIPEGPGLEDARLLIGGDWLDSASGGTLDHHYAGNGRPLGLVHLAGAEEVDAAVRAASKATPAWRALPGPERRRLLLRLAEKITENSEEFSRIATLEMGAASLVAGWNSALSAGWFNYYAGWADKIEGSVIPVGPDQGFDYTTREPYGVVGLIVAWNGPVIFIGMKAAPALAAGNCVIIKPSELAPFSSVRFGELALEAGIPEGVVNVIPGGPEAGDAMTRHPGIGKLSFTGSIATARKIIQASAETVKPLTLELGGKSAHIMFPDADLDTAVALAAMLGVGANSGQGCACGTRILVHESIHEDVMARLAGVISNYGVGDPFDPKTVVGPLVTAAARDRVAGVIDTAVADESGKLVIGGGRPDGDLADGYFVEPTVFDDMRLDSPLAKNEIFGPVIGVTTFTETGEAIQMANSTDYGLAAYVSTRDVGLVHTVAGHLNAGSVWINGYTLSPSAPFGGYRQSGFGREGGRPGLEEYLQTKNVFIGMPQQAV
jgi:acyl-CoA reductase-like NAD-dependent aldehyde dehydrogenase